MATIKNENQLNQLNGLTSKSIYGVPKFRPVSLGTDAVQLIELISFSNAILRLVHSVLNLSSIGKITDSDCGGNGGL
jgi:hypothetical protein